MVQDTKRKTGPKLCPDCMSPLKDHTAPLWQAGIPGLGRKRLCPVVVIVPGTGPGPGGKPAIMAPLRIAKQRRDFYGRQAA